MLSKACPTSTDFQSFTWQVQCTRILCTCMSETQLENICGPQFLRTNAAVMPSRKSMSYKTHILKDNFVNWEGCGFLVAVTGLHGCYKIYVAVLKYIHAGSTSLIHVYCVYMYIAVTRSMWLLQSLHGCYRIYVAVIESTLLLQDLCGCYRVYIAVIWSMWLLWSLHCCYRIYVVVTESTWLLYELCGCYGVYMAATGLCGCKGVYLTVTGSTVCQPKRNALTNWLGI